MMDFAIHHTKYVIKLWKEYQSLIMMKLSKNILRTLPVIWCCRGRLNLIKEGGNRAGLDAENV